jgi:O-acetyl-ADP-ribose deacetylase (regulator of RNase III)
MSPEITWSHPSVQRLLEESGQRDPYAEIARRTREIVLEALENGWSGPPFDPFELAERAGLETVPREDLDDARLVSPPGEEARIEFNPHRRPARVRFSVAHELGHSLFSDHGQQIRYRTESHAEHARADDWQLEVLCNVAAAEILMPAGAFPAAQADDLSLPHLLDLRAAFGVSTEALLRRVIKLTDRAACLFAATRLPDGGFRVDYAVASRAFDQRLSAGQTIDARTVLAHCTAVGFSVDDSEEWPGIEGTLRVQAVGIPPYPGHRFPRIVGLLQPEAEADRRVQGIRIVRGDATQPMREGPVIIAHIVNNAAHRWGGHGFANSLARRIRSADEDYVAWAGNAGHRQLGAVHVAEVDHGLWVASMVAQAGYGESKRARLRLPALRDCLEALAGEAQARNASVHMPPIGTGQGATPWPMVRDLILEELVDRDVAVTVYVLEGEPMPEETPENGQLTLA